MTAEASAVRVPRRRRWTAVMQCYDCCVVESVTIDELSFGGTAACRCSCGGTRTAVRVARAELIVIEGGRS